MSLRLVRWKPTGDLELMTSSRWRRLTPEVKANYKVITKGSRDFLERALILLRDRK